MPVYVDDMHRSLMGRFGRMKMSHLLADTDDELLAMADRIGVARRWHQHPGTHRSHFDIAMSKREMAIAAGAVPITLRQTGLVSRHRRLVVIGKAEAKTIAEILETCARPAPGPT